MSNSGTGDSMIPRARWGTVEIPERWEGLDQPTTPQRVACYICLVANSSGGEGNPPPDVIVMVNGTSYCPRHALRSPTAVP